VVSVVYTLTTAMSSKSALVELLRVRVREGFSTDWESLPYYRPKGSVLDLPAGLVEAAPHLFERVAADTPLHLVLPT
jgi:hypothetical protein